MSPAARSKVCSLAEAAALVKDGDHLAMSGFAVARNAIAFSHELIRQGRRQLVLSQAVGGMESDLLVAAGAVSKLVYGGGSLDRFGSLENVNRAAIVGTVDVDSYSSLAVTFRYLAGATGVPFMPITTLLGSDLLAQLELVEPPVVKHMICPFTGEHLLLVRALEPDFAIVQAQRADAEGNAQVLGPMWETKEAARAAKQVIVVAEELVPTETIRERPELTTVPGFRVAAVVPIRYGAHPTALYRCHDYDAEHLKLYAAAARKNETAAYLDKYVRGTQTHEEYLALIGEEHLNLIKADSLYGY